MQPNLIEIATQASAVVQQVAQFIRTEALSFDRKKVEYKGLNDMVSYVDQQAERQLVSGLAPLVPGCQIIGEEGTAGAWERGTEVGDGYYWIIDPLDGTTNFVHGLPVFSISVALHGQGQLLLGLVHEVMHQEHYVALRGHGATCNGQPIGVSTATQLSDSLIATGFPYYDFGMMEAYLGILKELMNSSHGLRRMGSAAVDLAYVACGRFEGFFEHNLKPWDVAAGILLVEEAGGKVTDFAGGSSHLWGTQLLAAGPVHGQLLQVIQGHWVGNN